MMFSACEKAYNLYIYSLTNCLSNGIIKYQIMGYCIKVRDIGEFPNDR